MPAHLPRKGIPALPILDAVVLAEQQITTDVSEPEPVNVCIVKYTDQASDLCASFGGHRNVPLYQIQIKHVSQAAVTVKMRESFDAFVRASYGAMKTLKQLETQIGVRLVIADGNDPDNVGFVAGSVAFYVTDACSFIQLLDGWFRYKAYQNLRREPVQVILHPHIGIELTPAWKNLKYKNYVLREPCTTLPLHVFEAQPPVGKRIVNMRLQIVSDATLSLILTGNTWPFRGRLEDFGIDGGFFVVEGANVNGRPEYVRIWDDINVGVDDEQQKFFAMLSGVFSNVVMRVSVDRHPSAGTQVAAFIERLSQRPALFFVTGDAMTALQ
eukprot:11426604-Karenia_brevis.AAC.1